MKLRTSARAALATAAAISGLALAPGTAAAHEEESDGCRFTDPTLTMQTFSARLEIGTPSDCLLHVVATCADGRTQLAGLSDTPYQGAAVHRADCPPNQWKLSRLHAHSWRKH